MYFINTLALLDLGYSTPSSTYNYSTCITVCAKVISVKMSLINDNDTLRSNYPECPGSCMGVDPNRNWEYEWGTGGSSSNCCSDTFKGPSAFSEIEVIISS